MATGQADAIMAQAAISGSSRYHLADVSHPMFTRTFRFYNRIPDKVTPMLTLAYPFDAAVWRFLVLSVFLIFLTVFMFNIVHDDDKAISIYDSCLIAISPMLGDSMPHHWNSVRSSWYGFTFLFIWLLSGLLLSMAYSSNLLANLISVESKKADDTFEDLVRNDRTLVLLENTALTPIMKTSPKAIIKQCYQVLNIFRYL